MIKVLKTITQKKVGFNIESYNCSKRLSEIIFIETGLDLSYNTIRRFFGIVKTVKPSNHTLNTIAVFNGYKNYNDFTMNFHLKNRWKQEFKLVSLMDQPDIKLLNFIELNLYSTRNFIVKLTQIIRELMLKKNYVFLLKLFSLNNMKFNNFNFDDVVYLGNCTGPLLKTLDTNSNDAHNLTLNENFIDLIFTVYVDYGDLNGSYGYWLRFIQENYKRADIKQFCRGVLNLDSYLQNKNKDQFYKLNLHFSFHPILKSRIIAQELFFRSKDLTLVLNNYIQMLKLKNETNIEAYYEIINTAIVTRNFEVMDWISERLEPKTKYDNFYEFEHYEHFGLMIIILHMYRKDQKNLNKWLNLISLDNFSRPYEKFMLQYVYILKYHNSKNNKSLYKTKYIQGAKDLYPSFFSEDYMENYFQS